MKREKLATRGMPTTSAGRKLAVKQLILLGLATLGILGCLGPSASAQDIPPRAQSQNLPGVPPANRIRIDRAVGLEITAKGEKYLEENFENVVGNIGVSLREGFFPEIKYAVKEPISFDEIERKSPETGSLIKTARSLMQKWFMGLTIQNPRPAVKITNAGYRISYARLALVTDRQLLRSLGHNKGVVFAVDAAIDSLEVGADNFLLTDANNTWIGVTGFNGPLIQSAPGRQIKLRIPVYVAVGDDGRIQVESLPATTGFKSAGLDFSYEKLVTPNISLEINGQKFPLNKSFLEQTFQEYKPLMITQAQNLLDTMTSSKLPEMVNKALGTQLPKIEQINKMTPPGAPATSTDPEFLWGLEVRKLNLEDRRLLLELGGWVEDPKNPGLHFDPSLAAKGPVQVQGVPTSNYDLALTVNRGLINRILQLSYERGYFKVIPLKEGKSLQMFAAPRVEMPKAGETSVQTEPKVRIRVSMLQPIVGLPRLLLNKKVKIMVDVFGRLVQNEPGKAGMRVVLDSIDEKSLEVPDENYTTIGRLFKGTVKDNIVGVLNETSAGWQTTEQTLPGALPLPPQFLGLNMTVYRMNMDPNGYIVMFLNFGGEKK